MYGHIQSMGIYEGAARFQPAYIRMPFTRHSHGPVNCTVGELAAEVMGDYGAGPNHVLPTGGTSKYSGGLSVFNFIRIRTWMRIDDATASQTLVQDAVALARLEGLEGHARAAECRLPPDGERDAKKARKS